ncbi:MAG TPA: DHA2 family efflux MFS transporter permease subunit [Thermoanaerobaculaceae bacterium]|nr:DHA2 family efflux MFS transporter permease subunit [Thermoanaerobaculaceae bacterium]
MTLSTGVPIGPGSRTGTPWAGSPNGQHPWLVALSVLAGTFMVVLDTTVVNVALPHIAGSLSASVEESTWALTSYLAANAIILPMTAWLARMVGRKRLLILAVGGFTTASALCGMAPSLLMLIVFRVLQGTTGGVMQPLSQAVMLEAFSPRDRGKAMGLWSIGIIVAPILGPVLGGWLTDTLTWRWVFYVNVPVGLVAMVMIRTFIEDPPYIRRPERIDGYGLFLLAIGIGALQIALDKGEEGDWLASGWILTLLIVAVVFLIALVVRELMARNPIVDLRAFKERTFAVGTGLITLMAFTLFGSLVMLPVFLQVLLGYPALQAGIALMPRGYASLFATPIVGLIVGYVDPRKLMTLGFLIGAGSLFWFSHLNLEVGYWNLFWPQFFQGMSFSLLMVPLTVVTMDRIAPEAIGNAASIFNLLRNLGGSVGIAVTQTLLARFRQGQTNILGSHVSPYSLGTQIRLEGLNRMFVAHGSDPTTAASQSNAVLWGMVQRQAAMLSYLDVFRLMTFLLLLAIPFVALLKKPVHQIKPVKTALE